MKYLIWLFIFLLPMHAFIITYLKCWIEVPENIMNVLRFWKEWVILALLFAVKIKVFKKYKFKFWEFFKDNNYFWVVFAFIICSFIYIFFPFFEPSLKQYLWFKYDVFFLFALLAGTYLLTVRENLDFYMKTLFASMALVVWIFLPFFLIWDISSLSHLFWYSDQVSTYSANSCIAFSQNVDGHHRFQWTFGGPIRFSVFLTTFLFVYLGYILNYLFNIKASKLKYALYIWIPLAFYLPSLYFSYTKTSILGFVFGITIFSILILKKRKVKLKPSFYAFIWIFWLFLVSAFVYVKRDLFLHLGSVLDRLNNFTIASEMFFNNPFGYGLWIAGPASIIQNRFWPENWFLQILLEQSVIWLALFVSVIYMLWDILYKIFVRKRDYMSIWIFTAYVSLVFMSNFTHAFEESATSYILFLFVWAYIMNNFKLKDVK